MSTTQRIQRRISSTQARIGRTHGQVTRDLYRKLDTLRADLAAAVEQEQAELATEAAWS
jgi:hypothetical protein